MTRDAATQRQVTAANPVASTWLSANAGSGKTSVLTNRVARLLLNGADPASILCLTYTKAAAFEMQNRLFTRLGTWAMLPEPELIAALTALGLDTLGDLGHARRLFARAIEAPGGLRIQTIHSFCAGLLRRFPLEAGVSPGFREMEDRAAQLLREDIVEDIAARLDPEAVAGLAQLTAEGDIGKLVSEIAKNRTAFSPPLDRAATFRLFGIADDVTVQSLCDEFLVGDEAGWMPEVISLMAASAKVTDLKNAEKLGALDWGQPSMALLKGLEDILLTRESKVAAPYSAKLDSFPTKDIKPLLGENLDRLRAMMAGVEAARKRRIADQAARRTTALHRFAALFLPEYAARKAALGVLDFDDLTLGALRLLTDPSVAQWVLYRLDGGLSHVLVDEAQDTSPEQWQVIGRLTEEILSGQAGRDGERTIFVVGDVKQSIYSFQGANVEDFDRMQKHFDARLAGANGGLQRETLEHSFRSSPAILRVVDAALGDEDGQFALGGSFHHEAFRNQMAGRVDLWPHFAKTDEPDQGKWTDPVDLISPEHHFARLARRIAEHIKATLAGGMIIPTKDGERPVKPGDFLILVRRRSELFGEVIRALKVAGLPVAGADRLKLGGELAVRDLASLLAFLATPEDDLALAEALRSPLLGWDEAALYVLAQGRAGYLWTALRAKAVDHPETLAILNDLRDVVDYLRPYDLIERILTRHKGRQRLISRLGAEAEEGIDVLLAQALAYERNDVPSLTGFLSWLQTDDIDIKRQSDGSGRLIRVMTVHGAKGLEAPIVILPDTADRPLPDKGRLIRLQDGPMVWKPSKDECPPAVLSAVALRTEAAQRESLRLLYVAMTRAQSWLIVAAAGGLKSHTSIPKPDDIPAWYDRIKAGMAASGAIVTPEGGLTVGYGKWPDAAAAVAQDTAADETLPAFARTLAPPVFRAAAPVSPSKLDGMKVLPGDSDGLDDAALSRGIDLHRLLQHLPGQDPALWPALSAALIADPETCARRLAEASFLLTDPALAAVFACDTLAEVAVTADLDGTPMFGSIDRLIIKPEGVLAVDFKSNRIEPETAEAVPEGLRLQLRAYVVALRQIYPDRRVEAAILWTGSGRLMQLCDL